jgi:asparagine synthase (glutamine-hydrolysing)
MCGLAGLININTNSNTDDALRLVTRMRDIQVHRGPDDTGIEEVGAGVYLASNRLAILDLTPAGHMPFKDGNGHSIAYNGEVYNFAQLREELEKLGHAFRSRTDTEVVLRAWIEWREECFKRFQGMFACAIYDTNNDVLILARDSLGKKPLYYMHQGGALLFASELKALSSVRTNLSPNHRRITEWSLYRNVDFGSRDTLFSDIFSLQPGHYLKIQRRQPEQPRQYFLPETLVNQALYSELDSLPLAEVTHRITQHIVHGVKTRLVADVPVGTLCSGGLDSSLITAICAKERPDLCAFNIAVKGYPQLDESVYAEKVSKSLGIKLVTYVADQNTFKSNLARAIYHSDQPLTHPNSVFFMKVSELARQHGVLVGMYIDTGDMHTSKPWRNGCSIYLRVCAAPLRYWGIPASLCLLPSFLTMKDCLATLPCF